ncbi:MAG: hypothetical protein ACYS47_13360 [Planctomycetota bacterium]|jgi:hypothetical protein
MDDDPTEAREDAAKIRGAGRRWFHTAIFFLIAAGIVGGIFLFWRFAYQPAEILSRLRRAPVPHFNAGRDDVPEIFLESFHVACPLLVDALLAEDENRAAVAFVALRFGLDEQGIAALREARFRPDTPGEPMFRLALLLEMDRSPGSTKNLEFPGAFLSAYLRWKATHRPGPFSMPTEYFLRTCEELSTLEGAKAVPFLLDVLRHPDRPAGEKIPVAVWLGGGPEAEDAYRILVAGSIPPILFLRSLLRRPSPSTRSIMKKAFGSPDPGQKTTALEYFLKFPDREAASLIQPVFGDPRMPITLRRRIGLAFLQGGASWSRRWVLENTAAWTGREVAGFLQGIPWPRYTRQERVREALRELILAWGLDEREEVPPAALNAWVSLEKWAAGFPYGREMEMGGGDPLEDLKPVARGLHAKPTVQGREQWAERALRALRTLESAGKVTPNRDAVCAAAKSAVEYFEKKPPGMEESRRLRPRLARLAGSALHRHGAILEARELLRQRLEAISSNPEESHLVRVEAAFWLALTGRAAPGAIQVLRKAMRGEDVSLRFACAAALARFEHARRITEPGAPGPSSELLALFRSAWRGSNPFVFYFAARETPNLPTGWMGEAVPPMLRAAGSSPTQAPDVQRVGREALIYLTCMENKEAAVQKAKWLSGGIPGGVRTVWADRAGVRADPEGDSGVLDSLMTVMETEKKDPGVVRAAVLLLRAWTGFEFGFDDLLQNPHHHGVEIAERWRRWMEDHEEVLTWDEDAGRFRLK